MTDDRFEPHTETPAEATEPIPAWRSAPLADPWAPRPAEPTSGAAAATGWPPAETPAYQPPAPATTPPAQWGQGYDAYSSSQYPTDQWATGAYSQRSADDAPTATYATASSPTATYPADNYGSGSFTPGTPTGTRAEQNAKPRGTWLPVLLVALLASLIGGGVGTAVTLATNDDEVPSPSPTATVTAPAPAQVSAPAGSSQQPIREVVPGSIASIADAVRDSVVEILVETPQGGGSGSGVVISAEGHILTNNHVVGDATQIKVRIAGRTVDGKLIGTDPPNDLAVIQAIDATTVVPAQLGTDAGLKVGDPVLAIGSPLGLTGTVTSGIISALDRRVDLPSDSGDVEAIYGAIQTDAAINPGNSGGALVDGNGKVIGINTAIASLGRSGQAGSIGLGFAIPIDVAKNSAEQLIKTGKAIHPQLGVTVATIDEESADKQKVAQGALVNTVVAGGPAEMAGLQRDDVITELNDEPVKSSDQLVRDIRRFKVGDKVRVTYIRRGQEQTAEVVLTER